jgi:hypothetical protein
MNPGPLELIYFMTEIFQGKHAFIDYLEKDMG